MMDLPKWEKIFAKYIRTKDEEKKHAKYSPSGMDRILGCAASVITCEGIPAKDNPYSIRGTHTHTLMEFFFKEGEEGIKALRTNAANDFKKHISYTSEMHQAAMVAVKFAHAEAARMHKATGVKPTLLVERKVYLNEIVDDDCSGTADIVLYQLFGVLHIMDYKNGTGVVDHVENIQMMTYALGVLHELGWDFSEVWMTIIQPNASHRDGPVRTWKTTVKRLQNYERELVEGIKRTKMKNPPFMMNDKWCFFCVGKHKCPEQQKKTHTKILDRFQKPSATTQKGETPDGKEKTKTKGKAGSEGTSKGKAKNQGKGGKVKTRRSPEQEWEG